MIIVTNLFQILVYLLSVIVFFTVKLNQDHKRKDLSVDDMLVLIIISIVWPFSLLALLLTWIEEVTNSGRRIILKKK
jgi:hypothetical protein